jgi:NAD(P)-dependent dehydrogenase (short-subunit alcohol dehydrogenase family)
MTCPLAPGSSVIALSSGAAIKGSPLSGGYAGAKAAVRFIAGYAAIESQRAGLGISFVSVLPQLTPATELGAPHVAAYAEREGVDVDTFRKSLGTRSPRSKSESPYWRSPPADGWTTMHTRLHPRVFHRWLVKPKPQNRKADSQ